MRATASDAWSSPSTERTPRIWASCPGTVESTDSSSGARKNWSRHFSASANVARNSSTTLPMVWRSLTLRYRSSIHGSSGAGSAPARTCSRRSAKRLARSTMLVSLASRSSNVACRYNTEVATSIANAAAGGSPERTVASRVRVRARARLSLPGSSLFNESHTRLN